MIPCPECDEPCNAYSKRRIGEGKEFYHRCKSCGHRFKTHQPDPSNPERFYKEMKQLKLSKEDRERIIARHSAGGATFADLSIEFGVTYEMIRHVVNHPNLTEKLHG
jgi:hypothetical protein